MSSIANKVRTLISSGSPESVSLEYKREPYPHTDGGRKEFAKDISAFANRDGGLLVLGVVEQAKSIEAIGIAGEIIDAEIQWLESVARSGVSPHLHGVRIEPVEIAELVLIGIEVPRGFEQPYEALQNGGRFFVREERSVRPMSREEIRSAVSNQINLSQQIDRFVDTRWKALLSNGGLKKFQLEEQQGGCLLVVTPVFDQTFSHRINLTSTYSQFPYIRAFHTRDTGSAKPNIDGLRYPMSELPSGKLHGYVQLYRHGVVEVADGYVWDRTDDRPIPGTLLCESIIESTKAALRTSFELTSAALYRVDFRARHTAGTPVAFFQSMFGERAIADRDELIFDPIYIEAGVDWLENMPAKLRPLLDALWQAFGYVNCGYFNDDGGWITPS